MKDGIGTKIRSERLRHKISLREFAKLCEISPAYLSQIERGNHKASQEVLRRISAHLYIPFLKFVAGSDAEKDHHKLIRLLNTEVQYCPKTKTFEATISPSVIRGSYVASADTELEAVALVVENLIAYLDKTKQ